MENRLQWGSEPSGEEVYGYGADNRRVCQSKLVNAGTGAVQELLTWWQGGKRAGQYELGWGGGGSTLAFRTMETNVWFGGGKPLRLGAETNVVADRLGGVRQGSGKDYFPYGQENPSTTVGELEKYATYMHYGRTDLAYADQRYYTKGAGRFMTADPAGVGLVAARRCGQLLARAAPPRHHRAQVIKQRVRHRRHDERQQQRQTLPADYDDRNRPPFFRARTRAERQRQHAGD